MQTHHPHFYGKKILRDQEKELIEHILSKYQDQAVSEDLKKQIWDELMMHKHLGNITIPFKVVMHKDSEELYPDRIEVILDTKV